MPKIRGREKGKTSFKSPFLILKSSGLTLALATLTKISSSPKAGIGTVDFLTEVLPYFWTVIAVIWAGWVIDILISLKI
nr:hypothetical protein [Moraxella oblonga]